MYSEGDDVIRTDDSPPIAIVLPSRPKTNKESIVRIKRGGSINLIFKIDQKGLRDGTSIKSCKVR